MPLPHRFTQSYMLLENQQFFKITEMPRIFIPHGDKVIIIHRLHVSVFSPEIGPCSVSAHSDQHKNKDPGSAFTKCRDVDA